MSDIHPNTGSPSPNAITQPRVPEERPRKRKRRTVACTQCRSRKLRCDREYPVCGRCQKSKSPASCTYEDGFLWQQPNTVPVSNNPSGLPNRGSTSTTQDRTPIHTPDSGLREPPRPQLSQPQEQSHSQADKRRCGEKRDRFLETVLGAPKATVNQEPFVNAPRRLPENVGVSEHEDNSDGDLLASPSQQLDISPRIMMRGKETRTRFNGSGILANLMSQFSDLRSFAEEIRLSYPNLVKLRPDFERIKRGLWKRKPLGDPIPIPDATTLVLLLPSRGVVDELVGLYMTYIESTHRILHIPSFLRELDHFWNQRQSPGLISPAYAAQLLLVLSCAWNLADFQTLQSKSDISLNCYAALEWVLYAEKWLLNASIKRPEITTLRIHILLITAKNAHGMGRSKAWLATGTLVKQAMLAGYHRDPSRHSKVSVFNKEIRRRIWATIVELDLQVAIDRGMPPSVQASDYDTAPPLNINDDEISEDITQLPTGRPMNEVTSTSFQVAMSKSLPLRLKACLLMHSPRISCHYDDILRMDWQLSRHLLSIPAWRTSEDDLRTQNQVKLMNAHLETKLGQILLCIHTPFAVEAQTEPLFTPSARARLEVATMMLSTQRRLHETSRQLSLSNMGDWTLQACCSVCQLLHCRDNIRGSTTALSRSLSGFPEFFLSLVETILGCLEVRLFLVVKGAKEYFFLSTLIALVKTKLCPAQANAHRQEVVDRILTFAQSLFTKHANCNHLGDRGMGNFASQVPSFPSGPDLPPPVAPGFDESLMQPTGFDITPPGDFDPFLDVLDWEDLTGIVLGV